MGFQKLDQGSGYLLGYQLTPQEYRTVCSWIRAQWSSRILSCHPDLAERLETLSLQDYHLLDEAVDHPNLWSKTHRIFSKEQVEQFQEMSVFQKIREDLGPVVIADIEGLGYPELYWRLVRPLPHCDVSAAHADTWFYTITNNIPMERQSRLCKFWLSIHTIPSQSGLSVHPYSHQMTWKYGSEIRHGRPKPVFLDDPNRLALKTIPLKEAEGIIFHTHLIHKGIAHNGSETRFSIECALELKS